LYRPYGRWLEWNARRKSLATNARGRSDRWQTDLWNMSDYLVIFRDWYSKFILYVVFFDCTCEFFSNCCCSLALIYMVTPDKRRKCEFFCCIPSGNHAYGLCARVKKRHFPYQQQNNNSFAEKFPRGISLLAAYEYKIWQLSEIVSYFKEAFNSLMSIIYKWSVKVGWCI